MNMIWDLVLFSGMGVELKGKIMFQYPKGVKRQQVFTARVAFYVYNVIGEHTGMDHNFMVVNMPESQSFDPRLFPGRREYDLLFDVDIVNLLLKNNEAETEGLMLMFL